MKLVKLGDIASYDKNQGSFDCAYVGLEDIESNSGLHLGSREPRKVKSNTFHFTSEHLLYGRLRPYLNKVLLPNFDGHCSTEIFPIKVSKEISREYLFYWFRLPSTVEAIDQTSTGARMPRANMDAVLEFELPLPSLEKQREIVEKLDFIFAEMELMVARTDEEKSESTELFRQVCSQFLRKLDPSGYSSLKEISQVITKGTTPTSIGQKFVSEGINFLKVESLDQTGGFVESKFAFIDAHCHQVLGRSQLQRGDLLVSIAGALGRTAIVTESVLPANINQALALVRLSSESQILPKFIFSLFQAGFFDEVVGNMSAGAAQQNLSLAQIGSLQIPILATEQQHLFISFMANLMEHTEEFVTALNRRRKLLDELNSSILSALFVDDSKKVDVA